MSLVNAPSKDEVLGWNTQTLADYMRRLNLSSCDNVVLQSSITGKQFMRMTQSQLQVFPSLYLPVLTNIQRDINTRKKKTFSSKSPTQTTLNKVFKQVKEVWKSDEFSSGSDNDYEYVDEKMSEENSLRCATEQPTAEKRRSKKADEVNDTLQPLEVSVQPTQSLGFQDGHKEKSPKTSCPHPGRMKYSPQRPLQSPSENTTHYSDIIFDKSKTPRNSCPSQKILSQKGSTVIASGSSASHFPQLRAPPPTDMFKRASILPPLPPMPREPLKFNKETPIPKKCLDPSWYRGNVTRHEAEAALRGVNKDGAFIVRDSSQGSAEHPHTLMVLKQGKVYNIRIRRQGNSYLLGNGFNTKSFPGVAEMIIYYTSTPLMLISATDQSSAKRFECCLLYPAGL